MTITETTAAGLDSAALDYILVWLFTGTFFILHDHAMQLFVRSQSLIDIISVLLRQIQQQQISSLRGEAYKDFGWVNSTVRGV
jgi:hypothetical protein